jgi:DNA-binding transcriptional LysR family regulator
MSPVDPTDASAGVQLLERHSRGVILTEAGELFLDKARTALAAVDGALAAGRDAAAGVVGHLRVGVGTHARSELGPKLLEAFREDRPSVDITVMEAHSDTLLRDVRDGRLDAAVVLGPVLSAELESVCLREERVLVAVGDGHPLAGRAQVHAGDLDGETVVISGDRDGGGYDQRVRDLLGALGVRAHIRTAGYGASLLAPVRSGGAVALLSRSGADVGSGVVARSLEPAASFRFDLAWSTGTPSPTLRAFIDVSRRTTGGANGLRVHPGGKASTPVPAFPAPALASTAA